MSCWGLVSGMSMLMLGWHDGSGWCSEGGNE